MKSYLLRGACIAALGLALAGCETMSTGSTASAAARLGTWGLEMPNMDTAVDPGDNFNEYVNGTWLATAEIPAGFSSAGGFLDLHLESQDQIGLIIDDASNSTNRNREEQQIGDLYASYLDRDHIEELGLAPIQEELDAVLASSTHEDIARWMGRPIHSSAFGLYISPDAGDPTRYITWIYQAGLNLPEANYYVDEDERFVDYRAAYVSYMEATFTRAGIDNPRERAEAVMALETAIAAVHWTPEQVRDRVANYDLQTIAELQSYAPEFPWNAFFEELGLDGEEEFVVRTNTAMQGIAKVFAETPVDVWASYLAFNFIDNQSSSLPEAYDYASWEFYSHTMRGVEEQRAMDLRAVRFTSDALGEVIGQVYVDRYFPQSSKDSIEELVGYLLRAYEDRINSNDWMDDATREEALAKLAGFTPKVGFPNQWRDYSSIEIDAGDLIGNRRALGEWGWNDSRSRLGGAIRDWEWGMSPQTVNAYYHPTKNEIVFPAAILQAPFFDINADAAINFGAIGGVIGHEIGHGFDDQGSRTDGTGLLRDWWTPEARAAFEERTSVLIEQYNGYSPIEGQNVNGQLTLGENIGDLGGLGIALHAYQMYVEDNGGDVEVLDGYTPVQRIFLGWAQAFRAVRTEDSLIAQMQSDSHSPDQYRINGIVRNIDAWYDAFGITEDDELYLAPEDRVSIW